MQFISPVLKGKRHRQRKKILMQHVHTQSKNNYILSKDEMKASCTSTEQCADIYMCRSVLFSILPVTGHTGALTASQQCYLTTMLFKAFGRTSGDG